MTCKECIHKSVCYRVDSVENDYARKCGDFVSDCEALEQESCDAVSRKAAIDACLKGLNRKEMVSNIKALPSVQPKQRTGRWEPFIPEYDTEVEYYVCSECRNRCMAETRYCYNCGAKMEEQS